MKTPLNIILSLIVALALSACQSRKQPELKAPTIYGTNEIKIIEKLIPVKCDLQVCEKPVETDILKLSIENKNQSYTERAIALKLYIEITEKYATCLEEQIKLCISK